MKTRLLTAFLVLGGLLINASESYACGDQCLPNAHLTVSSNNVAVGSWVTLDSSNSYCIGGCGLNGIKYFRWDTNNDCNNWEVSESGEVGDGIAEYQFFNPGNYNVKVQVTCCMDYINFSSPRMVEVFLPIPALESPNNESMCQPVGGVALKWSLVPYVSQYKVYLGTTVTPPLADTADSNSWNTGPLQPNTRYYWKIKAYGGGLTSDDSEMRYFTTSSLEPGKATNPQHEEVDGDMILSWTADANAFSHDVYFGTSSNELQFMGNVSEASYSLGALEPNVYYWRVDEVADCNIAEGDVWNLRINDVWYVNNAVTSGADNGTSWINAFYNLQSALDVADPNGDEIWVAKGDEPYYPTKRTDPDDPNTATFQLVSGVVIYGGFDGTEIYRSERDWVKNVTVLSGNIGKLDDPNDNCDHVVTCQDVNDVTLDGFTITGGNADGSGTDKDGAGIYSEQSTPVISKCIIIANTAEDDGGGVYCVDSNAILTNCLITENDANCGGGIYDCNSSPMLINCTFTRNAAEFGGGMYNYGALSEPNVTNCIFWDNDANNSGDGIYNADSADPNFSYCDIEDSNGSGGNWNTDLGNDCDGNIDLDPCFANTFELSDVTVADGTTTTIIVVDASLYDINDVIEYNDDGTVRTVTAVNETTDVITFENDPLDVNSAAGIRIHNWGPNVNDPNIDYHLASDSPCINAGDLNGNYEDQSDIYGEERVEAKRVDIGAYEAAWTVYNADKGTWGAWYTDIQDALDQAGTGDTIVVYPGTYYETIDFSGVSCTLMNTDPNDWDIVAATVIDANGNSSDPNTYSHAVTFDDGEDANSILAGFTITGGYASGTYGADNGGGIYCDGSSPAISKCIISGNIAEGNGGGVYDCNSSSPLLTNCIFSENDANCGGGMYNSSSTPSITSCTFTGNDADDYGGGICNSNSDIEVTNSILWDNIATTQGDEIYNDSSDPNISYSSIERCKDLNGTWDPNFGNNDGDNVSYMPYFEDSDVNNYHLLTYSPCIDIGDPCSDYSSEPSDGGGRINMGGFGNTSEAALAGADSDGDGIPEGWEFLYWPYDDPNVHDANDDPDGDNLDNLEEYHIGLNPDSNDTDGDGMDDSWEYEYRLDPLNPADFDMDADNDGLTNLEEYAHGANPNSGDTDGDQLPDKWEVDNGLEPDEDDRYDDKDGDDVINLQEYDLGTRANDPDSDDDGMSDGWEYTFNFEPTDSNDSSMDPDGDGYSNLSEYLHSSVPDNNSSVPSSNVTIDIPDEVLSIQTAIYASIDGDTIVVYPGTYYETIDFNDKAITLTSTDPNSSSVVESTVIDANSTTTDVVLFQSGEDANSVLTGLTLTNGRYGVFCKNSSSPMISKCVIEQNTAHGIYCYGLVSPTIENNKIGLNNVYGVYCNLSSSSAPSIENNWIYENGLSGIMTVRGNDAVINNNTVVYNADRGIRSVIGTTTISNCILWGNDNSDLDGCSATYSCVEDGADPNYYNISQDPDFIDSDNYDYHLDINSPCIDAGDPNGSYDGQMDIDCTTRVQLGEIDMGADEFSRIQNTDTGDWYENIQDALDQASTNDTIVVYPGTYYETIDFNGVACTLMSTEPNNWSIVDTTIIDANGVSESVVTLDAASVLKGFKITGGDRGIYCDGASPTISNCIITDNQTTENGAGMYCTNSASPSVTNCFFIDNTATKDGGGMANSGSSPNVTSCVFYENTAQGTGSDGNGGGIYNDGSSPSIINCTFSKNTAEYGGGLQNDTDSSDPIVINCIFWDNTATYGNEIYNDQGDPNFSYCDIEDSNGSGTNWDVDLGVDGGDNTDIDPNFLNINDLAGSDNILGTSDDGLALFVFSPCINAGDSDAVPGGVATDIKNDDRIKGIVDMGVYERPRVICVDNDANGDNDGTDWENAFVYLQDALAVAYSDDEIWVAEGTYKPDEGSSQTAGNRKAVFQLIEDVAIYGGFTGSEISREQRNWRIYRTILSGDIGTTGGYYTDNSFHVVKGADSATLDGFTITNGYANGSGSDLFGGGIYCSYKSPMIHNCTIISNRAYRGGGMYNNNSNPTLINCTFVGNLGTKYGGGMYDTHSNPTLTNCIFANNSVYSENLDYTYGGGVYNDMSGPILTNCTFGGNTSSAKDFYFLRYLWSMLTRDDGIYNYVSSPTLTNCIVWDGFSRRDSAVINYSCVKGWTSSWGGTGNLNEGPCFVNASNPAGMDGVYGTPDDGLRIADYSPCVDAANGSTAPSTDILGLARLDVNDVSNTGIGSPDYVDMGAYESYYDIDTDSDNMDDGFEIFYSLDPSDANDATSDADSDGMSNVWEYQYGLNPVVDDASDDSDNDGMHNKWEYDYSLNPRTDDTASDADNDNMPNGWEYTYNLDPTDANDANVDGSDGDGYTNVVEYLFGYDPNADDGSKPLEIGTDLPSFSQVDPILGQTLTFNYWLNKTADVEVSFTKTNAGSPAWEKDYGSKSAGVHQVVWDCNDNSGNLVERYFYDVKIDADNGTEVWESPEGENSTFYNRSTGRVSAYSGDFDVYKNIPVGIKCDMRDWATRKIDIVEDGYTEDGLAGNNEHRIYHICDRLLKPGWNSFEWYGRWDVDPNSGELCKEKFDVYFAEPGSVQKGAVIVYYDELLTNLRCNPYRILALSDEASVISYNLAGDAKVTIKVYDPDETYITLVNNVLQKQIDNPQQVILHGTSGNASGVYLSKEGLYRIEVEATARGIEEKLEGFITVYK